METKSRISISIDAELVATIDALCYPIARSLFINTLLTESLRLLREKRISLGKINSPVLRKNVDEFCECVLGEVAGYA